MTPGNSEGAQIVKSKTVNVGEPEQTANGNATRGLSTMKEVSGRWFRRRAVSNVTREAEVRGRGGQTCGRSEPESTSSMFCYIMLG